MSSHIRNKILLLSTKSNRTNIFNARRHRVTSLNLSLFNDRTNINSRDCHVRIINRTNRLETSLITRHSPNISQNPRHQLGLMNHITRSACSFSQYTTRTSQITRKSTLISRALIRHHNAILTKFQRAPFKRHNQRTHALQISSRSHSIMLDIKNLANNRRRTRAYNLHSTKNIPCLFRLHQKRTQTSRKALNIKTRHMHHNVHKSRNANNSRRRTIHRHTRHRRRRSSRKRHHSSQNRTPSTTSSFNRDRRRQTPTTIGKSVLRVHQVLDSPTADRGADATGAILVADPKSDRAKVPRLEPQATEEIDAATVTSTVEAATIVYATATTRDFPIPTPVTQDEIGIFVFYAIEVEGGGPVAAAPVVGIDPAEVPGIYRVRPAPKVGSATSSQI